MKESNFALRRLFFFLVALSWLLVVGTALAQSTGAITGTVEDPQGARIPQAQVTAKNLATNAELKTASNDSGVFEFPAAPIGNYEISVEAQGFKRAMVPTVVVNVGLIASVVVKMEVGQLTEAVTVIGEGQQVINTVSSELKNIVDRRQILDLPLPTRNPIDLARLQAGVAVPSGTNARTAAINGLRGNLTNITQDGINVQDNFVRTDSLFALSAPTVENTGEFSITIGTVGSDSGTGAAQVRIVTPSGTNEFHGSVFWFHRNDNLNANTFFNNLNGTPKPIQLQNRFGFRAGGPLYIPKIYDGRNKTFLYGVYEGFREPFSATRNRTVWTSEARQGIFRYLDSGGALRSVNLLQIAPGVRTANPVTQALLARTPTPNNFDVGDGLNTGGYRFNVNGKNNSDRWTLRVDQKLTERALGAQHNLEFVINQGRFTLSPDTFNGIEAPFPKSVDPAGIDAFQSSTRTQLATAIHSVINSRMYNEFRFGFQRAPVGFLRESSDPMGFFIPLAIGTSPQNTFLSQGRNTPVYSFIDNFSYVKGKHSMKMGFEARSTSGIDFNDVGTVKTVSLGSNTVNPDGFLISMFPGLTSNTVFNNARAHYHTLVGLLNNAAQTFNVTSPRGGQGFVPGATRERFERYRELNLYWSDQWRWRPNFTWNLGLRYEYTTVVDVVNGFALQPEFGLDSLYGISGRGNRFRPGFMPGSAVNNLIPGGTSNGFPLYNPDKNNFAPFIGFAYSPSFKSGIGKWLFGSEGKSSFRGGYAISYTREGFTVITNVTTGVNANLGLSQRVTTPPLTGVVTAAGVPVTPPPFVLPRSDVDNYTFSSGAAGFWIVDPNLRNPYVQQWSFGFERELPKRFAIEFRYVGNHAVKLIRAVDVNEVNIFENGFLQEFLNAQNNLRINGGTSFAPGAPGTVPLPIFSTLFAGLSALSGFANSTFIQQLNTGAVGSMAFTLANSVTFRNNRANLPANFFLANPNLNFARITTNGSFSNYHAFQMEVRRRFSTGLFMQANYTFSKTLTDSEGSQSLLNAYRTWRNLLLDKHRADFDITHTFNANWIYDLPVGPGRRFANTKLPVIGKILEGWQVQGLLSWHTSPYKAILSGRGTFNQFTGFNTAVPIGNAASTFQSNLGVFRTPQGVFWINPSLLNVTVSATTGRATGATLQSGLFAHPAPGTLGPMARNLFKSPRFFQTDFSVLKRTKITETANVEFRAEFFNFFNNPNFAASADVNFESTQFGRITSTFDARIVQLALRVNW